LNSFGRRRFAVARPLTWNSLPDGLRDPELSFDTFKRQISWLMYMQHASTRSEKASFTGAQWRSPVLMATVCQWRMAKFDPSQIRDPSTDR